MRASGRALLAAALTCVLQSAPGSARAAAPRGSTPVIEGIRVVSRDWHTFVTLRLSRQARSRMYVKGRHLHVEVDARLGPHRTALKRVDDGRVTEIRLISYGRRSLILISLEPAPVSPLSHWMRRKTSPAEIRIVIGEEDLRDPLVAPLDRPAAEAPPAVEAAPERSGERRLSVGGSVRGSYWSSTRTLDDREHLATSSVWLKPSLRLPWDLRIAGEGWATNREIARGRRETYGSVREAYLDWSGGWLDLRAGRQIVNWGRADKINPTDNITPKRFTFPMVADEDWEEGVAALKATAHADPFSLTGLWLLEFKPHAVPIREPTAPTINREQVPANRLNRWGAKLERQGSDIDWSLSYLRTRDLWPDLRLDLSSPLRPALLLRHHEIEVAGADIAGNWAGFGLRAEAAYTFTENPSGDDATVKKPFLFLVAGGDRSFLQHLNVNVQYLLRVVPMWRDPASVSSPFHRAAAVQQAVVSQQLDHTQHGISARVAHKLFNETLDLEVTGLHWWPRRDYTVRPKATYALNDAWKIIIGGDVFRGKENTFFGRLRDNTGVYSELRFSF